MRDPRHFVCLAQEWTCGLRMRRFVTGHEREGKEGSPVREEDHMPAKDPIVEAKKGTEKDAESAE